MATKFQAKFYTNAYMAWNYGEFLDEILGNFGLSFGSVFSTQTGKTATQIIFYFQKYFYDTLTHRAKIGKVFLFFLFCALKTVSQNLFFV